MLCLVQDWACCTIFFDASLRHPGASDHVALIDQLFHGQRPWSLLFLLFCLFIVPDLYLYEDSCRPKEIPFFAGVLA